MSNQHLSQREREGPIAQQWGGEGTVPQIVDADPLILLRLRHRPLLLPQGEGI